MTKNDLLLNRRSFLTGAVTAGFVVASNNAFGAEKKFTSEDEVIGLDTLPVKTSWRDVFDLHIDDVELKQHVEGFLNVLEVGIFPYLLSDGAGGMKRVQITGQQILSEIAQTLSIYKSSGITSAFQNRGWMPEGKFVIKDYNGPYSGALETASNTRIVGIKDRNYPIDIQIGTEYLKGAQLYDEKGNTHPVTVDGVLANEIAHVWRKTGDEKTSNDIERIITANMGGVLRDVNRHDIIYREGSNNGYQTLYQNVRLNTPSLDMKMEP